MHLGGCSRGVGFMLVEGRETYWEESAREGHLYTLIQTLTLGRKKGRFRGSVLMPLERKFVENFDGHAQRCVTHAKLYDRSFQQSL